MAWRTHTSVEDARAIPRNTSTELAGATALANGTRLNSALEIDGRLAGMIGLRVSGHRAELGYVLARPHWGRGLATEAARAVVAWALAQPTFVRVWAVCDVDNHASARVLEKTGMEREGHLRRWIVAPNLGDEPRDVWCYARVR